MTIKSMVVAILAATTACFMSLSASAMMVDVPEMNSGGLTFERTGNAMGWKAAAGEGFSGGYAMKMSDGGVYDYFSISVPKGQGTLSFKWKMSTTGNAAANLYVRWGTDGYRWCNGRGDVWNDCSIDFFADENTDATFDVCGESWFTSEDMDGTSVQILVSDVKWTPAPETVKINFNTRGGGEVASLDVAPGTLLGDIVLPRPQHSFWTFVSWMAVEDFWPEPVDGMADMAIPFHDITLYAYWTLPVSMFDNKDMQFSADEWWSADSENWPWQWTSPADSDLYISGTLPFSGESVDANFRPQATKSSMMVSVTGPAVLKFNMDFTITGEDSWLALFNDLRYAGKATLSLMLDGKRVVSWSKSQRDEIKLTIPDGAHLVSWELSGTPSVMNSRTEWTWDEDLQEYVEQKEYGLFPPSVSIDSIKCVSTKHRDSFGDWLQAAREDGTWIPDDLQRFAKQYEARIAQNPNDYEARIMHAATLLASFAESKTAVDYAKKFGYTFDYLGMSATGKPTAPSSWPALNTIVDVFVKDGVPVLKTALADLEAIPAGWTGTVLLSPEEYPVDEDTEIDVGDVLYARASLEATIGMAYFAQGYDLTADYAKADKATHSADSAYRYLTEQTKFLAKVRNATSLAMSKSWMTAALNRALQADAVVQARTDAAMHFIEYDLVADGAMIEKARNLTQKALVSLTAPEEIDVQSEIFDGYDVKFDVSLLPNDGLMPVYLGALFTGKITRDLLPAFQKDADERPMPVIETIKDPTIAGLLPEFTARTWSRILQDRGCSVAHQTVTLKLDGNGGKLPKDAVASIPLDFDEDSEECYYPELPSPTRAGFIFIGWATAKTGGETVREGDFYDTAPFVGAKTPTLYAQWLKLYTLTVKGEGAHASWDWSDEQYDTLPEEALDGEYEWELNAKGTLSVPEGATVWFGANGESVDKKGTALSFQKWTVSSPKANLGEYFMVTYSDTELRMPAENLTLTATYIDESTCGWVSATAYASSIYLGWDDSQGDYGDYIYLDPPQGAFEWSPDGGKTWYKASQYNSEKGDYEYDAPDAMLKKSKYTITWRSTDPRWTTAEKITIYLQSQSGTLCIDESRASVSAIFTYVPQIVVDVMTHEGGELQESSTGGTATMNPKDGLVPSGKTIALAAKANKNYAFQGWALAKNWKYGNWFKETAATWKLENNAYFRSGLCSPTSDSWLYDYIDPKDGMVHVAAVFKALADYSAEDIVFNGFEGDDSYNEASYDDDGNASVSIKAVVGCALTEEMTIDCDPAAFPLAYKLNGKLPDGIKFDAKTGVLSGTPKKAGDTTVAITATDPAKNSKNLLVSFHISPLPNWIVGEFRGMTANRTRHGGECWWDDGAEDYICEDPWYEYGRQTGILELTVKSDGKVSAKLITRAGSRSVSGNLSWSPSDEDENEDEGYFSFSAKMTKDEEECDIEFYPDGTIGGYADSYNKAEDGYDGGGVNGLRQNTELLAKSNFLDRYYTFAFNAETPSQYTEDDSGNVPESAMPSGYGYLTLKTDKKGVAKVAGQLPDGEKVSMSALAMPESYSDSDNPPADEISARLYLFASPSSYKKEDWFAMTLQLNPDGTVEVYDTATAAWTPAQNDVSPSCSGCSCYVPADNAASSVAITGFGAEYSAAQSLEDYYWNVLCDWSDAVRLEYSWKETYVDEDTGKAVSYAEYDSTDAQSFGGMFFNVEVKGDKKGSISLVEKSSVPWEQSWKEDGVTYREWNYYEDKKGNAITDPSQLSISFTKATGIFSGKANVYFDYWQPNYKKNRYGEYEDAGSMQHKVASLPYAGVMISDGEGGYTGLGAAVYGYKHTYFDDNDRAKTQTDKVSLPVTLESAGN